MDAFLRCSSAVIALLVSVTFAWGGRCATPNFVVTAPTDEMAQQIAKCAEVWREDLAVMWLGQKLPNWSKPCPIDAKVGQMGAGGQTTFVFDGGEVFGWKMQVQGTLERVLDSVIPHEVNHTIFASYFRRPLPRWADEGAATLFEHESERDRQTQTLNQVIRTSRRIPLKQLLTIKEYPTDPKDVMTLYAEGYSLASFLVGRAGEQGKVTYLKFLQDAHTGNWEQALQKHYGHRSIEELEKEWSTWFLAGSPAFQLPKGHQLAQADDAPKFGGNVDREVKAPVGEVARAQSPDEETAVPALRPITRELRAGRLSSDQPLVRSNGAADPEQRRFSSEGNGLMDISRNLRSNGNDAADARAPLSARALSPTADGARTDPRNRSYQFPAARQ